MITILCTGKLYKSRLYSRWQLGQCREHGRLYAQSQQWAFECEHQHRVPVTQKVFARISLLIWNGLCCISGRDSPPRQWGKARWFILTTPPPTVVLPAGLSDGRRFFFYV